MFKTFTKDNISQQSRIKKSVGRGIRKAIGEQFPTLEDSGALESILNKKKKVEVAKAQKHLQIVVVDDAPLFFNARNGVFFPHLMLLHQFPDMMPRWQVDKGAIRFLLGGANVMCPGLTSAGAKMETDIPVGSAIAIFAEGKDLPLALGLVMMSKDDILSKNKGVAIELIHYMGDGLWDTRKLSSK